MIRKLLAVSFLLAFVTTFAAADTRQAKPSNLSASEIVNQNIAARGGLQAWRSVQTMVWTGKLGVGGNRRTPVPQVPAGKKAALLPTDPRPSDEIVLPFKMDMQRPRKVRMEILFEGKTAVQIYDGVNGWKLRPYLNRLEVEPFTANESRLSSMQEELDGPLVDYAAKGAQVELDGMDKVDDRNTYKIKLTKKDGRVVHVWIDAQTFLEAKIEGQPRRLDGVEHPVEVYYRDYRTVNGLQIPFVLETRVLPPVANVGKGFNDVPPQAEKITIDKVEINPKLDASLFMKPQVQTAINQH